MRSARRSLPAYLAALFALLCQWAQLAAVQASPVPYGLAYHICMTGQTAPSGQHAPADHPTACSQCPLCTGLAAQATLPVPPCLPPSRGAARLPAASLAAPRSPHRPAVAAAPPRGPPALT